MEDPRISAADGICIYDFPQASSTGKRPGLGAHLNTEQGWEASLRPAADFIGDIDKEPHAHMEYKR